MARNEFIKVTGIYSTNDIKTQHRGFWFNRDTMRFFRSRVSQITYYAPKKNLIYFVSSEKYDDSSPRLYTIRSYCPTKDSIETVGEFQQYKYLKSAQRVCLKLEEGD